MAGDALESVYQKQAGTGRAVILGSDYDPLVEAQKVNAYKEKAAAAKVAAQKAAEKERLDAMKEFDFKLKETLDADMANTQSAVKELQIRAGELSQKGYNLGDLSNPEVRQWRNDYSAVVLQNEKDNKDFVTATEMAKQYTGDPAKYSKNSWDQLTQWASKPSAERPDFNSLEKYWDRTAFIKKNIDLIHEDANAWSQLSEDGEWIDSGSHTFISMPKVKERAKMMATDPDYRSALKTDVIDVMSPEEYKSTANKAAAAGMDMYEYLAVEDMKVAAYDKYTAGKQGVGTSTVAGARKKEAMGGEWFINKAAGWASGRSEGYVPVAELANNAEVMSKYKNVPERDIIFRNMDAIAKNFPHLKAEFVDFGAVAGIKEGEKGASPDLTGIVLRDNSNGKVALLTKGDLSGTELAVSKLDWFDPSQMIEKTIASTGAAKMPVDWKASESYMIENGLIGDNGAFRYEQLSEPVPYEERPAGVPSFGSGPAKKSASVFNQQNTNQNASRFNAR